MNEQSELDKTRNWELKALRERDKAIARVEKAERFIRKLKAGMQYSVDHADQTRGIDSTHIIEAWVVDTWIDEIDKAFATTPEPTEEIKA